MEIGVQTKGIYPERNAKQALQMIRNAGFTNIDFNIDAFLLNTDVYAGRINSFFDQDLEELKRYFHPMKECMKQYGICASQMHAPYPVMIQGREEQNRFMMEQVIPKSLAIASYLEIEWVVVHPIKLQYNAGIQKEREENMKFFQTLIPLLEKYHVKICLENLYESVGQRIAEGVCANPADAIAYIDKLNELAGKQLFGLCLDSGHLQLTHQDSYRYIQLLGNRIKLLHLHENDGIADQHQMPYSFGNGKRMGQNWKQFIMALKEIEFDGTLSFETYPCMNSFPDTMADKVLKTIYEIGEYWKTQIIGK